ncbi:MAG: methyltransferase family protein [Promethearchaeota archaeon]
MCKRDNRFGSEYSFLEGFDFLRFIIRQFEEQPRPIFLWMALFLMYLSHKVLFSGHEPSDSLLTGGILKWVRNPMYLGIMCIYIAFFCLSISFIALGAFVVIFLVYDKMVQYEE